MEATIEGGSENIRCSHMEYPIVDADSPPIRRTNKGRVYSSLSTIDRGPRPKYIAYKYLYSKYYTLIYIRMAYIVSTLYIEVRFKSLYRPYLG